jgi:hypothetical protein
MTDIDQDLQQLAREVDYPPTPPLATEVIQRLERGDGVSKRPARHRETFWSSRGPRIAAAAVGAAALLTAAPVILLGGSSKVQPAAAAVLRQAAEVAAVQGAEAPPGPGQYFFTRSEEASVATTFGRTQWSALYANERETWTSPDGTIRFRVVSKKPEFLSETQRRAWVVAGSPRLGSRTWVVTKQPGVESGHASLNRIKGGNEFLDTSDLPTEPKALREMIEARKDPQFADHPPGKAETFVLIGDLLRGTYLPPRFRAALYEVAAELPEVELLGEVEDPAGRTGIGIAYDGAQEGARSELIFNPNTSALLGERRIVISPRVADSLDVPLGTEIGSTTYLESGVVDSVPKSLEP